MFKKDNDTYINISLVEDDPIFTKILKGAISQNPCFALACWQSGNDFLNCKSAKESDITIIDYNLPDIKGIELVENLKKFNEGKRIIISGQEDVEIVVKAYKAGVDCYIIKNENCVPELMNSLKNLTQNILLNKELASLKQQLHAKKADKIIGRSSAVHEIKDLIKKASTVDILTLITGESGVGKDLIAREIHQNSNRKTQPFIPVNMAAIPKDLIESELFGHEKGAFTGAFSSRKGKFEEANKGTIFLDEIGEMDLTLQARLLRVLEDNIIVKIGSNTAKKLDIRVLAATNKDLIAEVKKGTFREDLYYRLQGFLIHILPLRERKDDIIELAEFFLNRFVVKNSFATIEIAESAKKAMIKYSWPGNVRELKSTLERAALLTDNNIITSQDLKLEQNVDIININPEKNITLDSYKQKIIDAYLKEYNNDIDLVANKLDIGRATIYRMIKKNEN